MKHNLWLLSEVTALVFVFHLYFKVDIERNFGRKAEHLHSLHFISPWFMAGKLIVQYVIPQQD